MLSKINSDHLLFLIFVIMYNIEMFFLHGFVFFFKSSLQILDVQVLNRHNLFRVLKFSQGQLSPANQYRP